MSAKASVKPAAMMNDVADFFLRFANEHGDLLTNLKLQKLLFYAQAWHLALHGRPLARGSFQAWVHGPVNPTTYFRFRAFRWRPIEVDVACPELSEEVTGHLEEVYRAYGGLTAYELELMTHREEPWVVARRGLPPTASSTEPISEDLMRSYYAARAGT